MIGESVSHYRIFGKLGSGGMGEVYAAEDGKLHRNVALKFLPPGLATDERRQRFELEARAIAALNHPNIVQIYSVEEAGGDPFITMELVEGKTLTNLMRRKGLPLDRFFDIAVPLADAVSAAHEQKITHRDLKPDNVMVNDKGRLKILDFGLAKLKPPPTESSISALPTLQATREGQLLGTVAYMSPEQGEGKPVDHRSDIFSIGIILYEMATGKRPFRGDSPAAILASIIKDTPLTVTKVNPELPPDLGKIIKRCLAKNPEDRIQSAKDLRNELRELKQELESQEALESASAVASSAGKKWTSAAALAAVVGVSVIGTYLLTRPAGEDSEIRPVGEDLQGPAADSRERTRRVGVGGETADGSGRTLAVVPLRKVLYDNPSVAMLPLRNLGGEDDEAFVEGLHEDVLSALQKIGGLTVISSTSVQRYRDRGMLLPEIARELGVDAVGEGTVSRGGDRIRLNIQLIDGATDAHLWSELYDRELTAANLFALRTEIARAVAREMRATLTAEEEARLDAAPPRSLTAYDWRQIALSRCGGCEERAEAYRRALEIDPGYAPAWSGLAFNHAVRVLTFGAPVSVAESALAYADRALELDPGLAAAFSAKATAYYAGWGKTALALELSRRAAQLQQGNGDRWESVGVFSAMRGRWVEALDANWRALRLQPTSVTLHGNIGELYAALDLPERAAEILEEGREINPDHVTILHYSSYAEALSGDLPRARELAERNVELHRQARTHQWAALVAGRQGAFEAARRYAETARDLAPEGLSLESNVHSVPVTLAFALLHTGDTEGAERQFTAALKQLGARLEQGADDGYTRVEMAAIDAARGRAGEAARWLESAYEAGYRYYREVELDPMFDLVRGDPGFEEIMARMRADVADMRTRVLEQEAELEAARIEQRATAALRTSGTPNPAQ
jgi:TolB-like protein/Tfp pilus assembly protein PilF/predicted Ser/Thr protein kinase